MRDIMPLKKWLEAIRKHCCRSINFSAKYLLSMMRKYHEMKKGIIGKYRKILANRAAS